MDSDRFDALSRTLTTSGTLHRRGLLALAAFALPGADIARGKKRRPKRCRPACEICTKCVRGRCKPDAAQDGDACGGGVCQTGACVCPAGQWGGAGCPQGQCCPDGQVCLGEGGCGACPPRPDFCASTPFRECGSTSDAAEPDCGCITSREGTTTCSSLLAACFACTTDAQCTAFAGQPAVCVDADACAGCADQNIRTLCMVAGCVAPPPTAAASRSNRPTWRRLDLIRPRA